MNDPLVQNQKLVIALCRKPFAADEEEFDNVEKKSENDDPID